MNVPFDPLQDLIFVLARAEGPWGLVELRLALDNAATGTVLSADWLTSLGYDLTAASEYRQMTTGSGVERVARLPVQKLLALGHERRDFPVVAHNLPPSSGIDGLLGLDFLRGLTLTLDFANGLITLT